MSPDIPLNGEPQFMIRSIGMNPNARAEFQTSSPAWPGIIEKSCFICPRCCSSPNQKREEPVVVDYTPLNRVLVKDKATSARS
jgi:hypothetical protein